MQEEVKYPINLQAGSTESASILKVEGAKITLAKDNWQNRTLTMKCMTCIFFAEKSAYNNNIGRCRRHAPTMNGYPVVYQNDWCGDHKLDETKV